MQPPIRILLLALLAATAGCLAGSPATGPGNSTATGTPTASPTSTAEPVTALPGPDCRTDAAPPRGDHSVAMPYPGPPERVNRTSLGRYVAALERAYVHNTVAEQSPDVERVETTVDDTPPVRRADDGYVVTLQYHLATYYDESFHGDAWPDVTYRVNESTVTRSQGADHPGPEGPVALLRC